MAPRKRKSGKRVEKTTKTGAEVGCKPQVVGKVGATANVADTGGKRRRRRKREDDECKGLLKNNNSGSVGASVVLLPGQRLTTDDGEKLERAVLCATASTNGRAQVAEKLLGQVEVAFPQLKQPPRELGEVEASEYLPEVAEAEKAMWDSAKEQNYEFSRMQKSGNPLAGRFNRWLSKDENSIKKEEYDNLSNDKERATWRAKWARSLHGTRVVVKRKMEEDMEIDEDDGEYLPFPLLVRAEGGGSDGLKAAMKYALKALSLGSIWVRWNDWTERHEFLHIRKRKKFVFKKAWQLYTERRMQLDTSGNALPAIPTEQDETSNGQAHRNVKKDELIHIDNKLKPNEGADAGLVDGGVKAPKGEGGKARQGETRSHGEEVSKVTPRPDAQPGPDAKLTGQSGIGSRPKKTGSKGKKVKEGGKASCGKPTPAVNAATKDAKAVIARYGAATAAARTIKHNVSTLEDWDWAKDHKLFNNLQAAMDKIEQDRSDKFDLALTTDLKTIKQDCGSEREVLAALKTITDMDEPVAALEKVNAKMMKRHAKMQELDVSSSD